MCQTSKQKVKGLRFARHVTAPSYVWDHTAGFRSLSNPLLSAGTANIKEEINRKKKKERISPSDTLSSTRVHTTGFDNWKKWKVGELHITLPIRFIQASNSDDGDLLLLKEWFTQIVEMTTMLRQCNQKTLLSFYTFFLFPCWQRHAVRGSHSSNSNSSNRVKRGTALLHSLVHPLCRRIGCSCIETQSYVKTSSSSSSRCDVKDRSVEPLLQLFFF